MMPPPRPRRARGFTLIELLVVIAIIALVSVATLPSIIAAINHRQIVSAASMLQGALVNARDSAVRANEPQGLRFVVDQALFTSRGGNVLAYSSWEPITFAPEYSEGLVSVVSGRQTATATPVGGPFTAVLPVTVFGPLLDASSNALPPTSWYWNIRRGDKIRFDGTGLVYTIVGPVTVANPEGFINEGNPGSTPSGPSGAEILQLSDGLDNNANGYVDELFDGVDNDGVNGIDDLNEFEADSINVTLPNGGPYPNFSPYTIIRRPMANARARVATLPADVVIDATTFIAPSTATNPGPNAGSQERSRLPIDMSNLKYFDLIFAPNGQVLANSPFAGTASQLNYPSTPFYHFWLTERAGVNDQPATATASSFPNLPLPPALKGERRLVTVNAKSGMVSVKDIDILSASDSSFAYRDAQNGVRDKP